jgi:hypothetical protein
VSLVSVLAAAHKREGEVIVTTRSGQSFDGAVEALDRTSVTLRRRSSPGFRPCPAVTIVIAEVASVTEVP